MKDTRVSTRIVYLGSFLFILSSCLVSVLHNVQNKYYHMKLEMDFISQTKYDEVKPYHLQ